jgi:hypothetical protein
MPGHGMCLANPEYTGCGREMDDYKTINSHTAFT